MQMNKSQKQKINMLLCYLRIITRWRGLAEPKSKNSAGQGCRSEHLIGFDLHRTLELSVELNSQLSHISHGIALPMVRPPNGHVAGKSKH